MTPDDDTLSEPAAGSAPDTPTPASPPSKGRRSQWFFRIEPSPEERKRFLKQLNVYLAAMYPRCPRQWRKGLLSHAFKKGHYGRLGEIAGVLVTNSIRHEATDYDRLMRTKGASDGLSRRGARLAVQAEVSDRIAEWQRGSAEKDGGYQAVRRQFRKAWRKGRKKPRPVLTANENAALAEYLKDWLRRPPEGPDAPEYMDFGETKFRVLPHL